MIKLTKRGKIYAIRRKTKFKEPTTNLSEETK